MNLGNGKSGNIQTVIGVQKRTIKLLTGQNLCNFHMTESMNYYFNIKCNILMVRGAFFTFVCYILGCFKSFVRFYESTLNCNVSVNIYSI